MNEIYYLKSSILYAAHLNMKKEINSGFENLTYEEMKKSNEKQNALKTEALEKTDRLRRERLSVNETIVKLAEKTVYSSEKKLRSNREMAKQKERFDSSLVKQIDSNPITPETQLNDSEPNSDSDKEKTIQNSGDLRDMTDDELAERMMQLGEKIQQ